MWAELKKPEIGNQEMDLFLFFDALILASMPDWILGVVIKVKSQILKLYL